MHSFQVSYPLFRKGFPNYQFQPYDLIFKENPSELLIHPNSIQSMQNLLTKASLINPLTMSTPKCMFVLSKVYRTPRTSSTLRHNPTLGYPSKINRVKQFPKCSREKKPHEQYNCPTRREPHVQNHSWILNSFVKYPLSVAIFLIERKPSSLGRNVLSFIACPF